MVRCEDGKDEKEVMLGEVALPLSSTLART
jgi:hypothetical protein